MALLEQSFAQFLKRPQEMERNLVSPSDSTSYSRRLMSGLIALQRLSLSLALFNVLEISKEMCSLS